MTLAPFEMTRQKLFAKYANREVLHENVTNEKWRALSMARQVPPGATWVAALATVYGPEPKRDPVA